MKITLNRTLITVLLVFAIVSILPAQESMTLQFMKGMAQSELQNPALHNDSSAVVIGLPGLSGSYVDFNSGFALNDLIHHGTGLLSDSLVLDLDHFYSKLNATNSVQEHVSVPLFFLRIRNKQSFFTFSISEKEVSQLTFDKRLIAFIKDGNASYVGQNVDLGNLIFNGFDYREFALGYSREVIKDKLSVGVKAKALYGKFAVQTQKMDLTVETAADGSSLILNSDMKLNVSAPITIEYDQDGYMTGLNTDNIQANDVIMEKGNFGMAFDIGAVYNVTPKLTFSGSVIDMGKISFKDNINNVNHVTHYQWDGIDFSNSVNNSGSNYVDPSSLVNDELNKMGDAFKPTRSEVSSSPFEVKIPTKINLGGTYQLSRKIDVGILDRIYKLGETSQNTFTVSANGMISNFLSLTGSYSFLSNSTSNLGLGLAIRAGFWQFYVVNDNMLAIADPAKVKSVSARFGMNFLFGRKHKPNME